MVFHFSQMMVDKERGRLFFIQMDGKNSVSFAIKKDKILIGRTDSCEIRIYVDGVAPEHCVITFNEEGKGFVEPVNKCGLLFLNGEAIESQVSLEHDDVITVVRRSFRFFYPPASKFFVAPQPAASNGEIMAMEHSDFEPEDASMSKEKDISKKRVIFGPEFNENIPPVSPLSRSSLSKTPCSAQDPMKFHLTKNLFKNSPASKTFFAISEMPKSRIVLPNLRCSSGSTSQSDPEKELTKPRLLRSETVKNLAINPSNKENVEETLEKYSPKRVAMKKMKLYDLNKNFFESPNRPIHPRVLAVRNTDRANSPEKTVICKKNFYTKCERMSLPSVKKGKSFWLSYGRMSDGNSSKNHLSDSHSNRNETNPLLSQSDSMNESRDLSNNYQGCISDVNRRTPASEQHEESSAVKQKLKTMYGNEDETPVSKRKEDSPYQKRNESNTISRRSENYTPERKRSPARRKSQGDISKKKVSGKEAPGDKTENEDPMERSENTEESSASVLVDANDNVDESSIDKSLKDSHNAVQALSYYSNVSALGNESSSAAVQKIALTVSMANAFHMYNIIMDDASIFPFCFPSTSFESSRDNMKWLLRSSVHQYKDIDIARTSWFQDIMRFFFSNSIRSDYEGGRRCMFVTCDNELSSDDMPLSVSNNKSTKSNVMSNGKIRLRAIDSEYKTLEQKSGFSYNNNNAWMNSEHCEMNERNNSKEYNSFKECDTVIKSNSSQNTPKSCMLNKEIVSPVSTSRHSQSYNKEYCLFHSPISEVLNSHNNNAWMNNEDGEINQGNNSKEHNSFQECDTVIKSNSCQNPPKSCMLNKEIVSPASTSRHSQSYNKEYCLFHSPISEVLNLHKSDLNISDDNTHLNKSDGSRKSSVSSKSSSMLKSNEDILDSLIEFSRSRKSLVIKRSPHISLKEHMDICPKVIRRKSFVTAYSQIIRSGKSESLKPKQQKVSLIAKKSGMTSSNKLKAQKREQKRRNSVLKKNFRVTSPKIKNLIGFQVSPKRSRKSLNKNSQQDTTHKPKSVRLGQNLLNKPKSRKNSSTLMLLGTKLVISPKVLRKRNVKRKPGKGLKSKKSNVSAKTSAQRKSFTLNRPLLESENMTTERSRDKLKNVKIDAKKDISAEINILSRDNSLTKIRDENKKNSRAKYDAEKLESPVIKNKTARQDKRMNDVLKNRKQSSIKVIEKDSTPPKMKTLRSRREVNYAVAAVDVSKNDNSDSQIAQTSNDKTEKSKNNGIPKKDTSKGLETKNPVIQSKSKKMEAKNSTESADLLVTEIGDEQIIDKVKTAKKTRKPQIKQAVTVTPKKNIRKSRVKDSQPISNIENRDNVEDKVSKEIAKDKKKTVKSKRANIDISVMEQTEFKEEKSEPHRRRMVKEKKIADGTTKLISNEENLPFNESNVDSEIPSHSKRGRKRKLLSEAKQNITSKEKKNVEQKKGIKVKANVDTSKKSDKTPKVTVVEDSDSEVSVNVKKGKKNMATNATRKEKSESKRKIKSETSPVQRVTRSLRSRK